MNLHAQNAVFANVDFAYAVEYAPKMVKVPEEEPTVGTGIENKYLLRASVIIPTYYRPDDLSELFNSLLVQIVKPIEVIVVDDTPTAAIRQLCEDYEGRFNRVRVSLVYMRNPRERSTTIARNLGARMARGDILIFLDSDVILYPDYVQGLLEAFLEHREAVGVGGWIVSPPGDRAGISFYFAQTLRKLFLLFHDVKDSCRYSEYPGTLTRTTGAQWLSGSTMAVKRNIFDELQFDENLKDYAFMEDVLFSGLINKRHPNKLYVTPYAKCMHKVSVEGRIQSPRLRRHRKLQNRKYVLTRLFGLKGLLMFGWQNVGLLVFGLITRFRKWEITIEQ